MKSNKRYKSIATHSLAIALFTNPYFILVLTDIYRILFNDKSEIANNYSMLMVMSTISLIAFTVSAVAFFFTNKRYEWITIVLGCLLVLLAWQLSQFYLPLSIIPLLLAIAVVIYRVKQHTKNAKKA